jgi:hypothetical protein
MFNDEIKASHPVYIDTDESYDYDDLAMQLVGERHNKRELVDLVRWLIMDSAKTAREHIGRG